MHKRPYDKGPVKLWSMAKHALFSGRWYCGFCPRFSGRWFVVWGFSRNFKPCTHRRKITLFLSSLPPPSSCSSSSSSPLKEMFAWSSFPVSGTILIFLLLLDLHSRSFTSGAVSKILASPDLVVVTSFIAFILSSLFANFQFAYSWYNLSFSIILWTLFIFWKILDALDVSESGYASFIWKII